MVPIPVGMRVLAAIVIVVSVPQGLALLFGPAAWYDVIWGWELTPMTARFIAGLYLSVAFGFALVLRSKDWEVARIPLAMLWSFAIIALLAAAYTMVTSPSVIALDRPFTWVWFFLYVVSVVGGLYYHVVYPRPFGAKPF